MCLEKGPNMYKSKSLYLNANGKVYILILVILISLLLTSCSMNTAVNTKPWGQNPKEVPCHYPTIALNAVYSVVFSPDSKTLITGCMNNQILVWDAQTGKLLKSLETVIPEMLPMSNTDFNLVFLSPDGKTVVNALMYQPPGTMQIWDIQKGELLHTLKGHEGWIRAVAFSPDSKIMASGGVNGVLLLWDIRTGKSLGLLEEMMDYYILSLAFSPDSMVLAVGHSYPAPDSRTIDIDRARGMQLSTKEFIGTIRIWDVQTRELLCTLSGHVKGTECMAFSPDSKVLASGGWDGALYLWDVQTGKQLKALPDTGALALAVAFSPDGRTLATGGWDGIVRLWDAETGVLLKKMRGFIFSSSDAIRSIAFSPDGETLAAGIVDGTAIMWNVRTGKRLRTLTTSAEHPNQVYRRRPEQALLENE